MLTLNGIKKLLSNLSPLIKEGSIEELENIISPLMKDIEEKEEFLNRYRNEYDGEEDSYDYEFEDIDSYKSKIATLENELYDVKKKYIDRFFGDTEIIEKTKNSDEITIEEVLKGDD